MPRFSERRGERRQNDDSYAPERGWRRREDGPWSPYNGSKRSHPHDERRFDERGRDYWREDEDESPREWYEPPGVSHRRERDDFSYGRERDRERWDDRGMRPSDDWS